MFDYLNPLYPLTVNIASGKTAYQSSVATGGVAARAVDGDKNTDFDGLSCSLTTGTLTLSPNVEYR